MRKWIDRTSFCEIPISDPLSDIINKSFSDKFASSKPTRNIMTIEQALAFDDPYQALITANSMRSTAILARNDLIALHPANVDEIMRLWLMRWWALLRLSMYDIIKMEADKLNVYDSPSLKFENYPQVFLDRTGPMISFELKIFVNTIPSFKGNYSESIHLMYQMLYSRSLKCYNLTPLQHSRIIFQIVNLLICMDDHVLAASVLTSFASNVGHDIDVWSAVGRLQ
jgi:hypothetical protein